MKALYIKRHYPDKPDTRKERRRLYKRRFFQLRGQDGFFRGSLYAHFDVVERDLAYLRRQRHKIARKYDYLIVSSKADSSGDGRNLREFDFIRAICDIPKALFISHPTAGFMPDDRCLDGFDILFKREHYRDLDRYPIACRNKSKIRLTWLACQLVPSTLDNITRIRPARYGFCHPPLQPDTDVCFIGKQSHPQRRRIWQWVRQTDISTCGGLQPHSGDPVRVPSLEAGKFERAEFIHAMRRARINLALRGLGEFTHRHLELWMLSAFCLSTPDIRELALPGQAKEGEHFVCFDSRDDLIDKIRFYSRQVPLRNRIARAGRDVFERCYDFAGYGRFIQECLDDRVCTGRCSFQPDR